MGLVRWAGEMVKGFYTVLVGMKITAGYLGRPPVTMHYPDEKWQMPENFRGLIKCDMDACIVCDLCVKACPVECITIDWKREPGKSGKIATRFVVDYQKCLYCGLCTEPCPTYAIFHSHEYENASYTREPQVIDWCLPENRVTNPNAKPMAKAPAKPAPKPAPPPATGPAPSAAAPAAQPAGAPAAAGTMTTPSGQVVESGVPGVEAPTGDRGTVSKVWIIPGCIVCDLCEDTAPEVFHVTETTSVVKLDQMEKWGELSDKVIDAAVGCPVNVIKYELQK